MNDSDWDFLKPWLKILAKFVAVPKPGQRFNGIDKVDSATMQPSVRYLNVNAYNTFAGSVWEGRGVNRVLVANLACAIEIVALALHVEPYVWRLVTTHSGKSLVDTTSYSREQLGAGVLLTVGCLLYTGSEYASLLNVGKLELDDALARDYDTSMQRLETIYDKASLSLDQYQIPLALEMPLREMALSAKRAFETIASACDVRTVAATTAEPREEGAARRPRYHLTDVFVGYTEFNRRDLIELEELGVRISSFGNVEHMGADTLTKVLTMPKPRPLIAASIQLEDMKSQACLHAMLANGDRFGLLQVSMPELWIQSERWGHSRCVVDLGTLVNMLVATKSKWASLHDLSVRIKNPLQENGVKAVEEAIASVLDGPHEEMRVLKTIDKTLVEGARFPLLETDRTGVSVMLPNGERATIEKDHVEIAQKTLTLNSDEHELTSSVESFSCAVEVTDASMALRVVRLLQRCLPSSLKTLALDMPFLDDECVKVVLEAFPLLETLRLQTHHLPADYRWVGADKTRVIEPSISDLSVTELIRLLTVRITKITQLQICFPRGQEAHEPFLVALETLLRENHRLALLKLLEAGNHQQEADERLRGFRLKALPTQRKLAFVSVLREASKKSNALASLDVQAVNAVMKFAEEPRTRRVCVESGI